MTDEKPTWRDKQAQARAEEYESLWGIPDGGLNFPDPLTTARQAFAEGHTTLQLDMPVAWVQGAIGVGTHATRYSSHRHGDVIGHVEAEGWRLQHVSTTFVDQGSSSTKRMFANVGSTLVAHHGILVGLYVFRRVT